MMVSIEVKYSDDLKHFIIWKIYKIAINEKIVIIKADI